MDNGKVKIYLKNSIPVIEIYHDGEIDITDTHWIDHSLHNNFDPPLESPIDLIIDRVGSYSLSEDAYMSINKFMAHAKRVAFVLHRKQQEVVSNLAANTYMSGHPVKQFYSIDEAFEWLADDSQDSSIVS
ncbi:MAG: hypothetical protein OQK25_04995 [Gammaproteobacteria bacterium]|nr:hypothetical protein [Gammaproteobacteria bacterium]